MDFILFLNWGALGLSFSFIGCLSYLEPANVFSEHTARGISADFREQLAPGPLSRPLEQEGIVSGWLAPIR